MKNLDYDSVFMDKIISNGCVSHAFLFQVDDNYKTESVVKLINDILNKKDGDGLIENSSDLKIIRPVGKNIKKEQINDLILEFSKKSMYSGQRFYIVENAENLNVSSSNALLKFLEEPADGVIAILITKNVNSVLSTVVSRCQFINFSRYIKNDFDENLVKNAFEFMKIIENEGVKSIAYLSDLYLLKSDDLLQFLNIWIYIYKCVLNYIIYNKFIGFEYYQSYISEFSKINSCEKVVRKIKCLEHLIELLSFNVNVRYVLDIMLLGGDFVDE